MREPDVFELLLSERIFRRLELRSARTSAFGDSDEKIAYFQGAALGTVCSRAVGKVPLYGRKMDHAVIHLRLDWTADDQVDLEALWKTLLTCHTLLKDQDDFLIWFEEDCDQRPLLRHSSATIGLGEMAGLDPGVGGRSHPWVGRSSARLRLPACRLSEEMVPKAPGIP